LAQHKTVKKPELLAPGGSLSKAVTALDYGADAVYIGGMAFSLRSAADNFSDRDLLTLLEKANAEGKKVYTALNILPRSREIPEMVKYAEKLYKMGVHGIIVADIGAFRAIHREVPELPIHVSTQANNLNAETCRFWGELGARRVNLARELTLEQIGEIHRELENADGENAPELEVFVHGAMCMAYSGRCMLSDYLTGRSSNRGECAQPCRWEYKPGHTRSLITELTEEKRPGEVYTAEETEHGTFLFNSKDLCLLEYLPELIDAGADALKIEGRMKSEFYTAVTVKAYREAIDLVMEEKRQGRSGKLPADVFSRLLSEVCSVSHRAYSTGFLLGDRGEQVYGSSSYIRSSDFIGIVKGSVPAEAAAEAPGCDDSGRQYIVTVSQRGNFGIGDTVELIPAKGPITEFTIEKMQNAEGEEIDRAPHPCMDVLLPLPFSAPAGAMLRRRHKDALTETES